METHKKKVLGKGSDRSSRDAINFLYQRLKDQNSSRRIISWIEVVSNEYVLKLVKLQHDFFCILSYVQNCIKICITQGCRLVSNISKFNIHSPTHCGSDDLYLSIQWENMGGVCQPLQGAPLLNDWQVYCQDWK